MSQAFRQFLDTAQLWYELGWPANLDTRGVTSFLRLLNGIYVKGEVRFIIKTDSQNIKHYVVVPAHCAQSVLESINTLLPEVEIQNVEPFKLYSPLVMKVRINTKNLPLITDQPETVSYAMLTALTNVGGQDSVLLVWVLGAKRSPDNAPYKGVGFKSLFIRPERLNHITSARLQDKHAAPSWKAQLFIGVNTKNRYRQSELLNRITSTLRCAETPGVRLGVRKVDPVCIDASYDPFFWPLLINVNELTGMLYWPLGDHQVHGIRRAASKKLPPPPFNPYASRTLAINNMYGNKQPLQQSPIDGLMHTHIIGPTGVGKTTLLLNLIIQDIQAGRSVVAIDPKGDLINRVLPRIPANRRNDVVVLDPGDTSYPVGLNPLARYGRPASLVVDDIMSIFRSLYGTYLGPRTQDILHAGLLTLSNKDMSLCALPILYTNAAFRNSLITRLNDPLGLGSFWSWFNTISDAERNTAIAPVMNKLRSFLLRPAMRRIIGQGRPRFDLNEITTSRKILLVSLAKGILGTETSQLFGSLVISQVWQTIQRRIRIPAASRLPMFIYVDEMQDYLHLPTDIGDVLAQARSYGVGMVLAHQYLAQLPPDLRSGVLSNARSRICFQLSHEDALTMSYSGNMLAPFNFESLDRFNVYARLVMDGKVLPWTSGITLPPGETIGNPAIIRNLSRQRYGRRVSEVDAEILRQISVTASSVQTSPIGHRRKTEGKP